jgi:hypothetical protein
MGKSEGMGPITDPRQHGVLHAATSPGRLDLG